MRNPIDRRRERMQEEFRRNRAGGHRVPTWALAAVLVLVLLAWFLLVVATG